jgi:CelD/BcsL family acetyltransferase involved in cellulose biosynthesis
VISQASQGEDSGGLTDRRVVSRPRTKVAGPELKCTLISSPTGLQGLLKEWTDLYRESGSTNPFAHPVWVTTWLDHYTSPNQQYVVTVRHGPKLVGVAPFYRRRRFGRLLPGISLQLAGTGFDKLTELPEILIAGHPVRKVLRELIGFLVLRQSEDWDLAELVLGPRQGWFEPAWIPPAARTRGSFFTHKDTKACVVTELPADWSTVYAGLKRNMKESLRRSKNRLARSGGGWEYRVAKNETELNAALDSLMRLHRSRANVLDKKRHADSFQDPYDEVFARKVVRAMFDAGHANIALLRIGDVDAAGRLVLEANGGTFFSVSGLDPAYWPYGAGTALVAQSLQAAINQHGTVANFSQHPEDSKLRWSEQLEFHNEFLLVGPRRASLAAFHLFWQVRAMRQGYQLFRGR